MSSSPGSRQPRQTRWHDVGARDALADPGSRAFVLEQDDVSLSGFLVCREGRVQAWRNRCPHTGVELNWGGDHFLDMDAAFIQCSMHGALFRPEDGHCVRGPCVGRRLQPLPVRVRDSRVEVGWSPDTDVAG